MYRCCRQNFLSLLKSIKFVSSPLLAAAYTTHSPGHLTFFAFLLKFSHQKESRGQAVAYPAMSISGDHVPFLL